MPIGEVDLEAAVSTPRLVGLVDGDPHDAVLAPFVRLLDDPFAPPAILCAGVVLDSRVDVRTVHELLQLDGAQIVGIAVFICHTVPSVVEADGTRVPDVAELAMHRPCTVR